MARRFNPRDHYFRKAQKEGLRARSAFKLEEVAQKHRLFRPGLRVLDLGAAPGGFLQVIAAAVGKKGRAVGVDLQEIADLGLEQVSTLVASVEDEDLSERLLEQTEGRPFDLICSDMAPATTGSKGTDVARSHRLVERTLELLPELLRPRGHLVIKVFMGPGFEELRDELRNHFEKVSVERPKAIRSQSKECYLVGLELKTGEQPG
ncbi:MAG: RlmE family RNA methyltransferase [Deltaproteobacteria bacterium]|nr:RlmE family RNA methyltransferase [Deltaproteobacteria bacterium]